MLKRHHESIIPTWSSIISPNGFKRRNIPRSSSTSILPLIEVLFVAFASLATLYYIRSEQETEQKYVDVLFLHRPPYFPTYQFAFELKYLKKSERDQLETAKQKANAPLQGYLQSEALQRLENLKAYVIVFVGSEAKAVEAMEL